jgi:eukaryotic-like serine/threonine-protein kinase
MARTLRLIPGGTAEPNANGAQVAAPAQESSEGPAGAGTAAPLTTAPVPPQQNPQPAGFPTDTVPDLRFGERPLGPNDKVDRYIIERLIAAGGMARVYRAHHEWSRRPVALKVLRTRYAGRPDLIDRFQKEAMALGQIKHPNVVTIENGGLTANGEVFIAMEFLEGKSLREVLQERVTLPIREALSILSQVAHGVTAAHDVNVVHRDIKPENIFCTSFGTVKVLDLGLAKIIGFDAKATDPEGLIGTAAYMSPEQLEGLPADARSDVYSLGLVAYECLAGFHALVPDGIWPSRDEIALRQLTYEPRPLRELPRPLWQVIARATHKNPAYRYASMEEFAAALHKIRHELGTGSSDPGPDPAVKAMREAASKYARGPAAQATPGPLRRVLTRYPLLIGAGIGLAAAVTIFALRARNASAPANSAVSESAVPASSAAPATPAIATPTTAITAASAAAANAAPLPPPTAAPPAAASAMPAASTTSTTPATALAPTPTTRASARASRPTDTPAAPARRSSETEPRKSAPKLPSAGLDEPAASARPARRERPKEKPSGTKPLEKLPSSGL